MPGTVCVGCKIPNGLILQLYRMEEHDEPVMAGGVKVVLRAVQEGSRVKINGPARYVGKDAPHTIVENAGLTFGVDADFFNEWLKRNRDVDFVKKGLVFAQPKEAEARAQAKDHRTMMSGMEPIDPKNLPPEFRGKVETAARA